MKAILEAYFSAASPGGSSTGNPEQVVELLKEEVYGAIQALGVIQGIEQGR